MNKPEIFFLRSPEADYTILALHRDEDYYCTAELGGGGKPDWKIHQASLFGVPIRIVHSSLQETNEEAWLLTESGFVRLAPGMIERRPIQMSQAEFMLRNGQVVVRLGPYLRKTYRFPLADPAIGDLVGMVCLAGPSFLGPSFPYAFFALYRTSAGILWQRVFLWGKADWIPAGAASLNHIEALYVKARWALPGRLVSGFCLTLLSRLEDGSAEVLCAEVGMSEGLLGKIRVTAEDFRFLQAFPILKEISEAPTIWKIGLLGLQQEGLRARLMLQIRDIFTGKTIQETDLRDLFVNDPEQLVARVLLDRRVAVVYEEPTSAAVVPLPEHVFSERR